MLAVYLSPFYIMVNGYLLIRILRWLGACNVLFSKKWMQAVVSLVYVFLSSSILTAFFWPTGEFRRIMKGISNGWLGILLYLLLVVMLADLSRFIFMRKGKAGHNRFGKNPSEPFQSRAGRRNLESRRFYAITGGSCAAAVLVLCVWGMHNARIIHVTPYEITVDKDGGNLDCLNVVLAADLHLGYNIGAAHMRQMVNKINEQHADLVVIAGDIFDNEYEAIEHPEELIGILQNIQSKYGVYACYGNHDVEEKILAGFTFGGSEKKESSVQMDTFLEKAGIHLLRDEAVWIDESFYLYGRPDAQRPGRGIQTRKNAAELMEGLDSERPVIVIDHEPGELKELAEAGVDVDLCGHTHDGQMFPANLMTALMWENSYGYLKKEHLQSIVTSGVGVFGPNMRVGTIAEICRIKIHFL